MRIAVDTDEVWQMAAGAAAVASLLGEALAAVAHVIDDGISTWCTHPPASTEMHLAAGALEGHARAARSAAAVLADQLSMAAQAYADVDELRPR